VSASDSTKAPESGRRRLALSLALLIGSGGIWGLTFSLAKIVTESGVHPFGLSLLHGALGTAMLLPYALLRGGLPFSRAHIRFYVIAGLLGTALPSLALFNAAPHLPAGILAIITVTTAVITYTMALGLRIERFAGLRALGVALGFVAMLMILLPEASLPGPEMAAWALFALLIPALYSAESVYVALRRPPVGDSMVLLCGMLLAGTLMQVPVVWAIDGWASLALPWTAIEWWIIVLAAINTLSYLGYLELVRIAGPVFAGQEGYVLTVSGVIWGMVIFGESHSVWVWAAVAVMFSGVALIQPLPTLKRK
jgi:drug/metabolite transporter (DMT)-like permease